MATETTADGAALRNAGMRVTRQRLAVLHALQSRDDSVTAQELHHELRATGTSPGLATIYRTLTALAEAGELDTFRREGEMAFKLCPDGHHHHLVCERCGLVQEVGSDEVEAWIGRVARRRGFDVRTHTLDVFGRCRDCR